MAAARKIKDLIQSFAENNEAEFYSIAMQIAASEARKGHVNVATELKDLIDKAKKNRSTTGVNSILQHQINRELEDVKDLIEVVPSRVYLNQMVLSEEIIRSLELIIQEHKRFNDLRENNLSPRRKILLTGPPGCGKTMTASMLASELSLPLYSIRLDGLISRYMGESITKLYKIFSFIGKKRAVYLFDEFDSIGSNRSILNDVGEIKRVLNSFLINIENDNSNSIIIAATNMGKVLDKALFRRFDDIIEYPLPNKHDIFKLFKRYLKDFDNFSEIKIKSLSENSVGLSFADIERVSKEILKYSILSDSDDISYELLLKNIENRLRFKVI